MPVYLIMFFVSIFFVYKYEKTNKNMYFILSSIPFILVSGLRYGVGTDYFFRYVNDYQTVVNKGVPYHLEKGFEFLDKIVALLTNNDYNGFWLLFLLTSLIFISLLFYFIYTYSINKSLSLYVFFVGGFFFGSLNILRQYLASSLILLGLYYFINIKTKIRISLLRKKNVKIPINWIIYIGIVLLASTIHSMSLICILIPFLGYLHCNKRLVFFTLFFSMIVGMVLPYVIEDILVYTPFSVYIGSSHLQGDLQVIPLIFNLILLFAFSFFSKENTKFINKKFEIQNLLFNVELITIVCYIFGGFIMLFERVAGLFSIFQIVSVPYFLNGDKKLSKRVRLLVLVLYFVIFIWLYCINNNHGIRPYNHILNT